MTATQGLGLHQPGLKHDPEWFKTAVFYEVLVRAFGDSNGTGAGDFQGVINRLDITRLDPLIDREQLGEFGAGLAIDLSKTNGRRWQQRDGADQSGGADESGNLVFRKTARNFNVPAATCGRICVAEVEEIVPVGSLDPDGIHLPGIYVHRIVQGEHEKRIEQRTVRKRADQNTAPAAQGEEA